MPYKKILIKCKQCGEKKLCRPHAVFCSRECRDKFRVGKSPTMETRKKMSINALKKGFLPPSRKGIKNSLEQRIKISKALKGKNSPHWQGGLTNKNARIRNGIEFRLWREAVFARDNWTCRACGQRGLRLHSHHIKNFADYPDIRFAIDNGTTMCGKCHQLFHKNYGKRKTTDWQLEEFLKQL